MAPEVQLASNDGFDAKQLRIITQMIIEHCSLLEASWHDYFS
ncbi:hypothetical protein [Vreelandella aquamarina]